MKKIISTVFSGIGETFKSKNYWAVFLMSFFVMFIFFTLIPVWTVAGNTISTQLDIFTLRDYAILTLLSGLYALFITMQIYVLRHKRNAKDIGTTVGGGMGALFAGIAGTAFCASCLAPLFALPGIGFSGVIFVLQYRFYFVIAIVILMTIAIYFTSKKVMGFCVVCEE